MFAPGDEAHCARPPRFRLPALFLAGIALAVLIATALALRLYQDYTREQSVRELRREVLGLSELFIRRSPAARRRSPRAPRADDGDRIYYRASSSSQGENHGLGRCRRGRHRRQRDADAQAHRLRVHAAGRRPALSRRRAAARAEGSAARRVRRREAARRAPAGVGDAAAAARARVAVAVLIVGGARLVPVAAYLGSDALARGGRRRIADGRYDVEIPEVPSDDEIGHLADRFREMAARLAEADERERNFLMTVSHELRTPLTAIRGTSTRCARASSTDPELASASLDVIAVEADRLARLVGDILDLAKLDAHRFTLLQEEVDMEALLEQAYSAFSEEARRARSTTRRDVDSHPVIVTDGDRVLQIISNLLQNAFRWTPDGGRIELSLAQANGNVAVDVDDSGPGIEPRSATGSSGRSVSRDGAGGTGLGLAIARELAVGARRRIDARERARPREPLPAAAAGALRCH